MYCLKCKKDLNVKGYMAKNNRYMLKSNCNICKGKKSKFISKNKFLDLVFFQIYSLKYQFLTKLYSIYVLLL